MLEGPIWKGLVSFAVPVFVGNLFQQFYNTADSLIVGNFLGKESLAAVGSSGSLILLLIGFFQGVAMGAGVLVAKYFGAEDQYNLQKTVHTAVAFGFLGGICLTVAGAVLSPIILRWMGTPDEVLPKSISYFRTYFLGALPSFLYNISAGILQNTGDSRHPLYYLMTSSVVNVVLDLLFIGVMHLDVAAAALATVISQTIAAYLCIHQLMRTTDICHLELCMIRIDAETFRNVVRFGLPSGVQTSVISLANVMVQANINQFGSDAMAGCGSYAKIEGFAFLPVTCFALGLSTFVGQNLGAKQLDRVKKGTRFGLLCCVLISELVGAAIFIWAPWLIALFNRDPDVVIYGVMQCRIIALFYCFLALSHALAGVMRGAGRAVVPMAVMFVCWCLFRVAYVTWMVEQFRSIQVIFSAYPVTWILSTALLLLCYYKSDWIHTFERLDMQSQKQRK